MDCRETQALLTAFHDGELSADDRAGVEEHLGGCRECGAALADMARADRAAGVPDPGPAYWDRFNARVMDRVEREADGPKVTVLRPKGGWMRQQLRYLVPAAAAAALVVVVVRYGGMNPGGPATAVPPAVNGQAAVPSEERMAKAKPESRAAAPAAMSAPPPPPMTFRSAPASPSPVTAADGMLSEMQAWRKKTAAADSLTAERQVAAKAESASGTMAAKDMSAKAPQPASIVKARPEAGEAPSRDASPCELARTLADRKRFREAEVAQRACLAQDRSAPAQEKGLVFLAELLDRQARFVEADAVIAEVEKRNPQSRPLDLYRQQRPMVQKRRE